jgi:hypothetical protein
MTYRLYESRIKTIKKRFTSLTAALVLAFTSMSGAFPLLAVQTASALSPISDTYVSTGGLGTDCTHAAPCDSFVNALAAVADTGTVHVANGSYAESFTVNKSVTIKSDHGRNNVTLDGQVTISHNDVTLQGLTVTNPTGTNGVLISDANNVTVTRNAFNNVGTSFGGSSAVQAVYVEGSSSGVSVDHNSFMNIGTTANTSSNKAIFVGDSTAGTTSNVTIDRNTVDNVVANQAAWPIGHGAYGVLVNHKVTGLVVTYNAIKNLDGLWAHAVGLESNTPGAVVQHNSAKFLTDHKGGIDSIAFRYESNPGALTTTMANDSYNGHQASNSTSVVAVNGVWAPLDSEVSSNTYPEVYFHGKYYYYGINAFATIEDALTAVSAGGTVLVESGTYSDVQATGAYQDNITVKGYSRPVINGLDLTGSIFNGLTFKDFSFVGDSAGYGNFAVTIGSTGSYANLSFENNIFDGQSQTGRGAIFLNRGFDGFTLESNTFRNYDGSSVGTVYSVVFAEAQSGTSGDNFSASNNKLRRSTASNFLETYRWKNVSYTSNNVSAETGRLLVWSDDSFSLGAVSVSSNVVKVNQGTGIGIYYAPSTTANLVGNTVDGAASCVKLDSVSDTSVTGNTFTNCSTNGVKFSQNASTAPVSASISSNTFDNSPAGIENNVSGFPVTACNNTFVSVTNELYGNPGPFNTVACQAPTLLSPGNGDVVNGTSLTNSWSTVTGATKYQYQSYDHSNLTGLRWDHEYNTTSKTATNVADGTVFYWRVRALDAYGNYSPWSDLWKVTVDNIAPVVALTTPSNGDIVSGAVTVVGTITDANPDHYYLVVKDSSNHVVAGPGTVNSVTFANYDWDTTALPDGTYTIFLSARDAAGNKDGNASTPGGSVASISVTIDNNSPSAPVATPGAGTYGSTQLVSLTSDDGGTGSGLAGIYYTTDGSAPGATSTLYIGAFTVSSSKTIKAIAYDNAGNPSAVLTAEYTINSGVVEGASTTTPQQAASGTSVVASSARILGSSSGNPASSNEGATTDESTGEVKAAETQRTLTSTDNKSDTTKNSNFLGLGWWWLAVLAALLGFFWFLLGKRDERSDK